MKTLTVVLITLLCSLRPLRADVVHAWIGDTLQVSKHIDKLNLDCRTQSYDTLYFPTRKGDYDYFLYYDKNMTRLCKSYVTIMDTCRTILYYRNGQMKSFQVYANASYYGGTLIRHQEWCDNGFLRSDEYVDYMKYYSHTTYYCNGEKQFVGNFRSGMNWDTATWYYPNGQNKMQKYFTPYPEDGKTEHNPWEESHARYWKENGDTLPWEYNTDGFNLPPGAGIPYGQTPAGTIDYYRVKSKWYQNNMQVFRDSVYKLIKLPDSCYCKYGTISIGFFVEEDGLISDIRIDHDVDPAIAHAFKDAIAQIRYWPKANTEGVPTRISVYMSMSLENVPRK